MEFLISLVICILITLAVYYYFDQPSSSNDVTVSSGQDGKISNTYSGVVSVSDNQGELTFSYAGWVRVDDFTYRLGEQKTIFSKGTDDMISACPAFAIDANANSFLVVLDTFGTQEIIPISNIPAKKWIHFAIVVEQTSINVYINGTLHTHHTINQLPRQNSAVVNICPKGGFGGKVGLIQYYPSKLSPQDVSGLSANPPAAVPDTNVYPPYSDSTWWIKKNEQHL